MQRTGIHDLQLYPTRGDRLLAIDMHSQAELSYSEEFVICEDVHNVNTWLNSFILLPPPSPLQGFSNYSLFHCIFHISGNKVLVGPSALGLKENATAYLFWKNTNCTVQISSGFTWDWGETWGTGTPSSLLGIVRILYMQD